jgi:mono/diheme cytochrome c family protein
MILIKRLCGCLIVGAALAAGACVQVQAPTDTGDVATATSSTSNGTVNPPPTSTSTGPFSYNQDVKAILDSDCLVCHGPRRADAGYSVATYAQTMRAVSTGRSNSAIVSVTRSSGSMYRYWSGSTATRQAKADLILKWIVNFNAQENR